MKVYFISKSLGLQKKKNRCFGCFSIRISCN